MNFDKTYTKPYSYHSTNPFDENKNTNLNIGDVILYFEYTLSGDYSLFLGKVKPSHDNYEHLVNIEKIQVFGKIQTELIDDSIKYKQVVKKGSIHSVVTDVEKFIESNLEYFI